MRGRRSPVRFRRRLRADSGCSRDAATRRRRSPSADSSQRSATRPRTTISTLVERTSGDAEATVGSEALAGRARPDPHAAREPRASGLMPAAPTRCEGSHPIGNRPGARPAERRRPGPRPRFATTSRHAPDPRARRARPPPARTAEPEPGEQRRRAQAGPRLVDRRVALHRERHVGYWTASSRPTGRIWVGLRGAGVTTTVSAWPGRSIFTPLPR